MIPDLQFQAASAVKQGDGQSLAKLIASKQLDLNRQIPTEGRKTLIMLAVIWEQPHLVEYLLQQRVDLTAQDELGRSVQDYAQESPLMQQIISGEAFAPDLLSQILIDGIQRDQATKIAFALSHGAAINQKTVEGTPLIFLPLQLLTGENEAQKLRTSAQLFASPEVDPNSTDSKRMTFGMWAIIKKSPTFFRLWHQLPTAQVNGANERGETAILLALAQGQMAIIQDLMADQDVNVNVATKNETLLLVLMGSKQLPGPAKLELFDQFAQLPHFDINQLDSKYETLLFWSLTQHTTLGHEVFMRLVENPQVSINQQNNQGNSVAHLMILKNLEAAFRQLLQRKDLNLDVVNKAGKTPRQLAVQSANPIYRELINLQ